MGAAREIAIIGTRGDGKTQGLLGGTIAHADAHHGAGYPLPVKWMAASSTFRMHEEKTLDSLRAAMWRGTWRIRDGGHQALFGVDGTPLVDLRLFGIDDERGMERLRAECHCVWFEEPAPAGEIGSHGMSENQWGMAITSMRLPSHANVAVATMNYPDEDDWTWRRWVTDHYPGSLVFRIPRGENPHITAEQRAQWMEAIRDPVMRARLLEGRPGTIIPGRPVAHGFNEELHVSRAHLAAVRGATLHLGQDGGLMPATVIAQRANGRIEILAALSSQHAGVRQHFQHVVIPWIGEHAPWVLEDPACRPRVCYDETMDTGSQADIETNALRVMQRMLPGVYRAGQNRPWAWRRDPLLAALAAMDSGHPLLAVDPECRQLIKAWRGMWHYTVSTVGEVRKEEPKKPNPPWADLGDASAYLLADIAPLAPPRDPNRARQPTKVEFSPFHLQQPRPPARTEWNLWR